MNSADSNLDNISRFTGYCEHHVDGAARLKLRRQPDIDLIQSYELALRSRVLDRNTRTSDGHTYLVQRRVAPNPRAKEDQINLIFCRPKVDRRRLAPAGSSIAHKNRFRTSRTIGASSNHESPLVSLCRPRFG